MKIPLHLVLLQLIHHMQQQLLAIILVHTLFKFDQC